MSKKRKLFDENQAAFDFDAAIDSYEKLRGEILGANHETVTAIESYSEACIEIAAAIKRAIRRSGMSREAVLDGINAFFFDWMGESKKRLSIHMFNHYLSKPCEYPIPAAMLFAVLRVTGSLEPVRPLVEAEGGRVITGDEVRKLALGKIDDAIIEMQKLKREIRGTRK
jgi:hypothetical protein